MSAHSAVEEPPRSRQLCPKDHFHLHSQPLPDLGGVGGGGGGGGSGGSGVGGSCSCLHVHV